MEATEGHRAVSPHGSTINRHVANKGGCGSASQVRSCGGQQRHPQALPPPHLYLSSLVPLISPFCAVSL